MNKTISVEEVKKLRELTDGGVMECKKALEEAKGNLKKAQEILAKKGAAKAAKKKDRETSQGYVATYTHNTGKVGVILELLSETDFVARNEGFRQLAHDLCLQIASMDPKNDKELLKQDFIKEPGKTIKEVLETTIAKFGENIQLGRFERFQI